jgi:hypothetical protein
MFTRTRAGAVCRSFPQAVSCLGIPELPQFWESALGILEQ